MCRSIKKLRRPEEPPTEQELNEAALQFVRKVSGYRTPSRVNEAAFNQAVTEIAAVTRELLDGLVTHQDDSGSSKHNRVESRRNSHAHHHPIQRHAKMAARAG